MRSSDFVRGLLDLDHPYQLVQEVGVGSAASRNLISQAMFIQYSSPLFTGSLENFLVN